MNSNGKKTNSHDHGENGSATEQLHQPLDKVLARDSQDGVSMPIYTGIFMMALNRALLSGATEPEPEDLRSLEEHALAMARDTYREKFDPACNTLDRMHHGEYERFLKQREEIEKGVAHAHANFQDAERALALTLKAGPKPEANTLVTAAFIVAITVTISPTLHDFIFFGIPDELLAWFGSSVCGAFVAAMVTLAILAGRKTRWEWIGVAAGIVLGVGLGALRISSAHGIAEVLFALGLTVVEISAVLLLEWLASGLRRREDEWLLRKDVEDKATGTRDAERAGLDRRQQQLQEVNEAIRKKIAYVEDRTHRNVHLPELEAAALKTAHDGYNAGLNKNRGHLRGTNWRTP